MRDESLHIDFYFDLMCPWAYQTSKWIREVRQHNGLDIRWKFFSLEEVNRLQTEADEGVQKLLTGETDNVAEVFAAANKAGIAFDLLMEIRNKLTEAYRDIQQMRV